MKMTQPLKRQSQLQQMIIINIFHCFSEKIILDVSSEFSALLSLKDNSRKLKYRLLQFLFGALRVKTHMLKIYYTNFFSSQ